LNASRGRFITFEGIDGAGKSTHVGWFAERLREKLEPSGKVVVLTREPGGTSLGEHLRELLLHEAMHKETEALLMFAARREHLAQVIEPALQKGDWVISDRFTDASFAYQGGGHGLAQNKLVALEQWVHPHLQPDLTFLFDLPTETARQRLANARDPDKFERQDQVFFENVRNGYLQRVRQAPTRFEVIDGTKSIPEIREILAHSIGNLLDIKNSSV
jgi:dTMP kinase